MTISPAITRSIEPAVIEAASGSLRADGINLFGAYSFSKIVSSYAGPLIRLRRSSDNAERDIYPDGFGNLDEDAVLRHVISGNATLARWYDQSGNGFNFVTPDATNPLNIVVSGVINKDSYGRVFGNSGGFGVFVLAAAGQARQIGLTALSQFIVTAPVAASANNTANNVLFLRTRAVSTSEQIVIGQTGFLTNESWALLWTDSPTDRRLGASATNYAWTANEKFQQTLIQVTNNNLLYKNGTQITLDLSNNASVTTDLTPSSLAATVGTGCALTYTNCKVYECIFAKENASSYRARLENAQKRFYGI